VAEPADGHRRALVSVKVAGTPLAEASLRALAEVRVEQSLHVPDAFTLRFNDHDLSLLGGSKFDLGVEVEVGVDVKGVVTRLMTGEVTALCAELDGYPVPASVQHDDLHMANVYAHDGANALAKFASENPATPTAISRRRPR